jgi:hypothetical protein
MYSLSKDYILRALGLCVISLLFGCVAIPTGRKPMPTPVPFTPTPHYTPMEGTAYIVDYDFTVPLLEKPEATSRSVARVPPGTPVEILDSVWYYVQHRYGDTYCYIYHIRVQGTRIEGWLEQDGITQERGKKVPAEQRCFQEGQPTPTPSQMPLSGTVYVNVGEGNGVAVSYRHDPREYIKTIFSHGLQVEILNPVWVNYAAGEEGSSPIQCYMYWVYEPVSGTKTWLPEDVLTLELSDTPRRDCFPDQIPSSVYKIAPVPPKGFDVIAPESNK